MALAGFAFAWVGRAHYQQRSVAQLVTSNPSAVVLYEYQVNADGSLNKDGLPPGPAWLRDWLGIDFMSDVAGLEMLYATNVDLECVARFPHLRRLHLERTVDVTDEGLQHLKSLRYLRWLVLGEANQVTDAGLQTLAKLKRLKVLRMDFARHMTAVGVEELKESLPNCEVEIRADPDEPLDKLSTIVR